MTVKIDKISVKDLGPVKDFSMEFGLFNLIYSQNEKGKTFLTEFIIRSLFKFKKGWGYLREGGKGKVSINGLEDGAVEFSPSLKRKLEDYWEADKRGLSSSLAKLLVVKGGEAEIEETEGGISKHLIKEVLSGINILDRIDSDNNISKTVKQAKVSNKEIIIPQRGEGEKYNDLKSELGNEIEKLFEEIENKYTEGIVATYKMEEGSLQDQLEALKKAKRHEAYLVNQEIEKLKGKISQVPEGELNDISTEITLFNREKVKYIQLGQSHKELQEKGKHFNWLECASREYKELATKSIRKPSNLLLFTGGFLAIASLVLFLLNQNIWGTLSFLGAFLSAGIYAKRLYDSSKYIGQSTELNRIKAKFNNRIGKELTDIALLGEVLEEQRKYSINAKEKERDLESLNGELQGLQLSINEKFLNLTGKEINDSNWETTLKNLKGERCNLQGKISEEEQKLFKLGIDETDYLQEDIGIKYSRGKYEKTESDLNNIKGEIKNQEQQLNGLKFRVIPKTGDDLSISWDELIENLRKKRQEKQNELKEITAKIIAGVSVHKIISQLREEEDAKIQEGLESETVLKPLRKLTQRYNRLTLDNDKLTISDDYQGFDLRDLSTGAKEQAMLALRIGFSSKILKQDTLFLILDDAFQHCDWQKREILVRQLADIAKENWQIIYLTMDDHIKGLFDKVGKEFEEKTYISFELK